MNISQTAKYSGTRSRRIAIFAAAVFMVSSAALANADPRSRLPEKLEADLIRIGQQLDKSMESTDQFVESCTGDRALLLAARDRVKKQDDSTPSDSGQTLRMGLEGAMLYCDLFTTEAKLNHDALQMDALVIAGILQGEGYAKLDATLQVIETAAAARSKGLKGTTVQLEQATDVIHLSEKQSGNEMYKMEYDDLEQMLIVQKLRNTSMCNDWDEVVVPVTTQLRELVDQLAKSGR